MSLGGIVTLKKKKKKLSLCVTMSLSVSCHTEPTNLNCFSSGLLLFFFVTEFQVLSHSICQRYEVKPAPSCLHHSMYIVHTNLTFSFYNFVFCFCHSLCVNCVRRKHSYRDSSAFGTEKIRKIIPICLCLFHWHALWFCFSSFCIWINAIIRWRPDNSEWWIVNSEH